MNKATRGASERDMNFGRFLPQSKLCSNNKIHQSMNLWQLQERGLGKFEGDISIHAAVIIIKCINSIKNML